MLKFMNVNNIKHYYYYFIKGCLILGFIIFFIPYLSPIYAVESGLTPGIVDRVPGYKNMGMSVRYPMAELMMNFAKSLGHNIYLNNNVISHLGTGALGLWYPILPTEWDPFIDMKSQGILPSWDSYMSVVEYLFFLPNHHSYDLTLNENLDIARLLQFFDTTQYLNSYYLNKPYSSFDFENFYISISPRYVKVYSEYNQLLCYLDRYKNVMVNLNRSVFSSWNIITNLKRSWNILANWARTIWNTDKRWQVPIDDHVMWEWDIIEEWTEPDGEFRNRTFSSLTKMGQQAWFFYTKKDDFFSKQNLMSMKFRELRNQGLNPFDKELWNKYSFKVVHLVSPLFKKYRYTRFLQSHALTTTSFDRLSTSTEARQMLNNTVGVQTIQNDIHSLLKDCLYLVEEINRNHWDKSKVWGKFSSKLPKDRTVLKEVVDLSPNKINFLNDEMLENFKIHRNRDYISSARIWNITKKIKPFFYSNTALSTKDHMFAKHLLGVKLPNSMHHLLQFILLYKKVKLHHPDRNLFEKLDNHLIRYRRDLFNDTHWRYNIFYEWFHEDVEGPDVFYRQSRVTYNINDFFKYYFLFHDDFLFQHNLIPERTLVNTFFATIDDPRWKRTEINLELLDFYRSYAIWYANEWGKDGEIDQTTFDRSIQRVKRSWKHIGTRTGERYRIRYILQLIDNWWCRFSLVGFPKSKERDRLFHWWYGLPGERHIPVESWKVLFQNKTKATHMQLLWKGRYKRKKIKFKSDNRYWDTYRGNKIFNDVQLSFTDWIKFYIRYYKDESPKKYFETKWDRWGQNEQGAPVTFKKPPIPLIVVLRKLNEDLIKQLQRVIAVDKSQWSLEHGDNRYHKWKTFFSDDVLKSVQKLRSVKNQLEMMGYSFTNRDYNYWFHYQNLELEEMIDNDLNFEKDYKLYRRGRRIIYKRNYWKYNKKKEPQSHVGYEAFAIRPWSWIVKRRFWNWRLKWDVRKESVKEYIYVLFENLTFGKIVPVWFPKFWGQNRTGWEHNPLLKELNKLFYTSNSVISPFVHHNPHRRWYNKKEEKKDFQPNPGLFEISLPFETWYPHSVFVNGLNTNPNWLNWFPDSDGTFNKSITNNVHVEDQAFISPTIYCNPIIDWRKMLTLFNTYSKEYYNPLLTFLFNRMPFHNEHLLEKLRYHYFLNVVQDIKEVEQGYLARKPKKILFTNFTKSSNSFIDQFELLKLQKKKEVDRLWDKFDYDYFLRSYNPNLSISSLLEQQKNNPKPNFRNFFSTIRNVKKVSRLNKYTKRVLKEKNSVYYPPEASLKFILDWDALPKKYRNYSKEYSSWIEKQIVNSVFFNPLRELAGPWADACKKFLSEEPLLNKAKAHLNYSFGNRMQRIWSYGYLDVLPKYIDVNREVFRQQDLHKLTEAVWEKEHHSWLYKEWIVPLKKAMLDNPSLFFIDPSQEAGEVMAVSDINQYMEHKLDSFQHVLKYYSDENKDLICGNNLINHFENWKIKNMDVYMWIIESLLSKKYHRLDKIVLFPHVNSLKKFKPGHLAKFLKLYYAHGLKTYDVRKYFVDIPAKNYIVKDYHRSFMKTWAWCGWEYFLENPNVINSYLRIHHLLVDWSACSSFVLPYINKSIQTVQENMESDGQELRSIINLWKRGCDLQEVLNLMHFEDKGLLNTDVSAAWSIIHKDPNVKDDAIRNFLNSWDEILANSDNEWYSKRQRQVSVYYFNICRQVLISTIKLLQTNKEYIQFWHKCLRNNDVEVSKGRTFLIKSFAAYMMDPNQKALVKGFGITPFNFGKDEGTFKTLRSFATMSEYALSIHRMFYEYSKTHTEPFDPKTKATYIGLLQQFEHEWNYIMALYLQGLKRKKFIFMNDLEVMHLRRAVELLREQRRKRLARSKK